MTTGLKTTAECLGFAKYTSTDTAFHLTDAPAAGVTLPATDPSAQGNRPQFALLQADAQNIRWRDDGTAPAAGTGMLLTAGDAPFPYDGNLSAIQFIATTSGAILSVSYYK